MMTNSQTQTYPIPNNQLPLYGTRNPSPTDSMSPTPSNVSPTSPRLQNYFTNSNQPRQLRNPKTPLYVPAVLRPTEFFPSKTPLTPPKSLHGSLDSLVESELNAALMGTSTSLDGAMLGDWINDEDLGEVTGPPGKEHWKPDEASTTCDSPKCRSSFNIFVRKHHCRHCGHIFCSYHTAFTIPLNQDAHFHPDGTMSRACDACHHQFQRWDNARSIKRKNSNEGDSDSQYKNIDGSGPPTPLVGSSSAPTHRRTISGHLALKNNSQVASSVPKEHTWSTF